MVRSQIERAQRSYRLSPALGLAFVVLPWIITITIATLLILPTAEPLGHWLVEEDHPVENVTFIAFLAGGIGGLALARRARREGEGSRMWGFYGMVGLFLFGCGMEEISWGQRMFHYTLPWVQHANIQREANLHNLPILDNLEDPVLIVIALAGLWSARLFSHPRLRSYSAPSILGSMWAVILIATGLDWLGFYVSLDRVLDLAFSRLIEVVEMWLGIAGLLYVWLNGRMLAEKWNAPVAGERDPAGPPPGRAAR